MAGAFSTAYSSAFDALTPSSGLCYPSTTDWSCVGTPEEIAQLDPVVKERAEMLAWSSLSRLTGFRLSLCPTVVRPCATRCNPGIWEVAPVSGFDGFSPYISNGRWYNACGCKPDSCACTSINELILPDQEVSGPVVVKIDGATLDPSAYRVDNGNRLVRQDGTAWPYCQDFNVPAGEEGSFTVSYYVGVGPDPMLNYAAGVLAGEWYKACQGKGCRLPSTVTQVVRQGVTFEMPGFASGSTGIREVDEIVAIYNPNGLKIRSRVVSVDSSAYRSRKRTA